MSLPEIPRFIVAIQNDAGENVAFEVRPERSDGNGGFITGRTRPATKDDLLAILTADEADIALSLASANARTAAAEEQAAIDRHTLAERDDEVSRLSAELTTLRAAHTAALQEREAELEALRAEMSALKASLAPAAETEQSSV